MPKSVNYRRAGGTRPFHLMPPLFRTVDDNWVLNSAPTGQVFVAHTPTVAEPRTHTLTYQYTIIAGVPPLVPAAPRNLRGHVHYTPGPAGHVAGPGRYWIEGIADCDAQTPPAIVAKFSNFDWLESGLGEIDI